VHSHDLPIPAAWLVHLSSEANEHIANLQDNRIHRSCVYAKILFYKKPELTRMKLVQGQKCGVDGVCRENDRGALSNIKEGARSLESNPQKSQKRVTFDSLDQKSFSSIL
jgi:hypothetical protein